MAQRRKMPWVWLVVAAVLLAAGAWLMRGAEPPERKPAPPVTLPTRQTRADVKRNVERRTLTPLVEVDAGVLMAQPPRDPVLALVPAEVKEVAVVAEWNAIVNSDLGGLLLDCLGGDGPALAWARDAGLDPVQGIDRVAIIDDTVVVTGDFKKTDWKGLMGKEVVTKGYGRQGEVLEVPTFDGGVSHFGTWGGQMLLWGESEEDVKRSLDRLEQGSASGPSALDDSMAYGEVYGVVAAGAMAELFDSEEPKLAELVRQSAKTMQLHMDVTHDVGLVADVQGESPEKTEELRRALGGALSLARMRAEAKGKTQEAELLDLAHVRSADGRSDFRLEAGLPYEFMAETLKACAERRKTPRKRAVPVEPAPAAE